MLHGAEPRAWRITKIDRTNPNGVANITLYQDAYDQHHDYIEYADKDDPSSIIGMYADFYRETTDPVSPDTPVDDGIRAEIQYSGKGILNVGGSFKKFNVSFYDGESTIDFVPGIWKFTVNGEDVSTLLSVLTNAEDNSLPQNMMKCRFNGNEDYIGETLVVSYEAITGIRTSINIKIGGL